MKICDAVRPELIFLGLKARNTGEALAGAARELGDAAGLDASMIEDALIEREELGSTSVGNGFAIPHCKLENLENVVVALARFDPGVDFSDTKDQQPVRFVFVVLSPPDQPTEHLRVLSQIARILKNSELRRKLLEVSEIDAVVGAIGLAAEEEGL